MLPDPPRRTTTNRAAGIGLIVAVLAFVLAFVVPGLGAFLMLVAAGLAVFGLVRAFRGSPTKGLAFTTLGVVFASSVAVGANAEPGPTGTSTTTVASDATSDAPVPPPPSPPPPSPSPPPPPPQTGNVTEVIDGDTFGVAGQPNVRVLGIDSCEMDTPGGVAARSAATGMLLGKTVTLLREPGVDLDRYGRQLRYVRVDGTDLGTSMVGLDNTGVYAGRNDAAAGYVASLVAADPNGRTCGSFPPPAPTTTSNAPDSYDLDRPYVPAPTTGAPRGGPSGGGAPYYANCSAARAAGAAPLSAGSAGYRAALDRDEDGVACE